MDEQQRQAESCAGGKEPAFEKQMERLRKIVETLETGNLSLDKGVSLYKEGLALAHRCRKQLENARHEVRILNGDALETFRPENDGERIRHDG